jgi:hypothetical protein
MKKKFGGDPSKLKKSDPKKFAAAETRVTQKYLPKINEMKMERVNSGLGSGVNFSNNIISSTQGFF